MRNALIAGLGSALRVNPWVGLANSFSTVRGNAHSSKRIRSTVARVAIVVHPINLRATNPHALPAKRCRTVG
jgi:hypothetical protein